MNSHPLADALEAGRCGDPFAALGLHVTDAGVIVRAYRPGATAAAVLALDGAGEAVALPRVDPRGLFEGAVPGRAEAFPYRLGFAFGAHETLEDDPYRFGLLLAEDDLRAWVAGRLLRAQEMFGAHPMVIDGVSGVRFAVWAPNASRVSVVGDFNAWDGRRHPMRKRLEAGVWELFLPGLTPGARYKYEIAHPDGGLPALKADPFARAAELRPATASLVAAPISRRDDQAAAARAARNGHAAPISIYEVHLGSWRRRPDGSFQTYAQLADELAAYIGDLGFTHVQLLPLTEHPFDGSWGYQPTGLYAPTARFGGPDDFAAFVARLQDAGIGVLADFVPAHFPEDAHGLARFDGTALFEHPDPRKGWHQDWTTHIYNFESPPVVNFLTSSALYWLETYGLDGLRVDAVSSMLYLDYSRKPGEWVPNIHGGNTNLEATRFLQNLNTLCYREAAGVAMIAEESTAWSGVSRPVETGGLGFGWKWNLGWMHDTLGYFSRDPVHRQHHHGEITFGLLYAFSENFILPLSHDEVVHGKGSLLSRMPGDDWQRFANLRALYTLMWAHPGKKLLFMGGEFAQGPEWNCNAALDWGLLDHAPHRGVQRLVCDLNRVYRTEPALHAGDHEAAGFAWLQADAAAISVYAFARFAPETGSAVVAVLNLTPVPREAYRLGVPSAGSWEVILNSDDPAYGGSGAGTRGAVQTDPIAWDGREHSILLDLPPLGGLYLQRGG